MYKSDIKLRELFIPNNENLVKLDDHLKRIYFQNCLNQSEINERFELFFKIKTNFLSKYPG